MALSAFGPVTPNPAVNPRTSPPASPVVTRRDALKTVALGALALPFLGGSSGCASASSQPFAPDAEHGLRLGVAGFTFRNLTAGESVSAMKMLRLVNVGVYKKQLVWETATPDEARAVAKQYQAAGIVLASTGVIALPNDEAKCRRAFENVRAASVVTMIGKPDPDALPLVEKLVREYDQRFAIHNHGPEDKVYPTPASAFAAIESRDARMGICLDVGHAMRAKADPVAAIRRYAARVYDLHLKDSVALPGAEKDIPVEIGIGRIDIRGVLRALLDINYRGVVGLEYEREGVNPVTGLAESAGFVRGALAAMT
jgi:sugar phosphate isomerase/epimerase